MEGYLEAEAKRGNEAAAFNIGGNFYPIRPMGLSSNHFIGDVRHVSELLEIGHPLAYIHSHLNCSPEPSKTDLDMMNLWTMEWIIYSIIEGEIDEIWSSVQP